MKIVIAPNAYKGSLSATAAANAIAAGFESSRLVSDTVLFPIGDGGTGTGELLTAFLAGEIVSVQVLDPLKRLISATYGLIENGRTAVIDIASAAGIHLLRPEELNPIAATSFGVGQFIRDALGRGVRKIIVGVGGTATVDGGAGILQALGARFFDSGGTLLVNIPEQLEQVAHVDFSQLDKRLYDTEITVLCDVVNPVFGQQGGVTMFGPQKGASNDQVGLLERIFHGYFGVLAPSKTEELYTMPFGGAAGGIGAALHLVLGAKLVDGIAYFLQATAFSQTVSDADLVVTGEGCIDNQTLYGKAPFGVAKLAKLFNIPVVCLCGIRPKQVSAELNAYFDAVFAIGEGPTDLASAMKDTAENLFEVARQIGNLWAAQSHLPKT